ncbi:MAG: NUDIX hydrolase [Streptosporangiaceae bacterium]
MTPAAITPGLLRQLATGSHAEGITALDVAAAICHDTRILLIAEAGTDFTDDTWQLPAGPVLPGHTLTDALDPAVAAIGLSIDEVTGYLGHDDDAGSMITRTFCFAVTVTDPQAICRTAGLGHHWADIDDLSEYPDLLTWHPAVLAAAMTPASTHPVTEPPLAGPLRAWASGIYPDEAACDLLINQAAWLARRDFRDRFMHLGTSPGGAELASIDWHAAITALNEGSLPCSGGEERILRLAASLGDGLPVNLRDSATGIDTRNAGLLSQAVLHANGHRPAASPR